MDWIYIFKKYKIFQVTFILSYKWEFTGNEYVEFNAEYIPNILYKFVVII